MNNILPHIYFGLTAETAIAVLAQNRHGLPSLAITVPDDAALLQRLYRTLAVARHQAFIFSVPHHYLPGDSMKALLRFFFLPNYAEKNGAPIVLVGDGMDAGSQSVLDGWGMAQGIEHIAWLPFEKFTKETSAAAVACVMQDEKEKFLSLYRDNILKLTWLHTLVICQVDTTDEAYAYMAAFNTIMGKLKAEGGGAYDLLTTLRRLEWDVRRKEKKIQYQETEINNLKLYSSMAGVFDEEEANPDFNNLPDDTGKLKSSYIKLWKELVRLKKALAWYKRTYEERSTLGVLKEKLMKNIRK